MEERSPKQEQELEQGSLSLRIGVIDALRGLAVLGICVVNIPEMIGNGISYQSSYTGMDALFRLLYDMFVQTKFYTLFAFLFGLSFYLFMHRAETKQLRPYRLMSRRLGLLLAAGIGHAVLLWCGDVLHVYALLGFLLLLFYKRLTGTILAWSLSLLGLAVLLHAGLTALAAAVASEALDDVLFNGLPSLTERVEFLLTDGIANFFLMLPEILGLFLLGLYAGKKGWFAKDGMQRSKVRLALWIALPASVLFWIPMVLEYLSSASYNTNLIYPYMYLSGKAMAIVYLCLSLLLYRAFGDRLSAGLSAVGRMAFTNYLMQTIITVLLFQVLIDASDWPMWAAFAYACLLFAAQLAWSRLWLKRFRMGPFEWLWRAGTYGSAFMRGSGRGRGTGTGTDSQQLSAGS